MATDAASHALAPSHAREAALIASLLAGKSVADSAAVIGVSKRTVYRMKDRESFQRAYSQAKAELLDGAIAKLHSHASDFISTLHSLATDPKAQSSARVQASREGLSALFKGIEIFDISDRLLKLEQLAGEGTK
jgi:hypothetical protein